MGKNASFQLAALHLTIQNLLKASSILHIEPSAHWREVQQNTPFYAVAQLPKSLEYPEYTVPRIVLWEGMDLIESHRHHSHLAGIFPFQVFHPQIAYTTT